MPALQGNDDHYAIYYADKLWKLLPAVYRAQDSDTPDQSGPLRTLIDRIGAQAAILRRSIDQLWADQSIESCDDWVIPYMADLLATNLVASLDARGQRIDVAKTIYYRRRKGTVAVLEEIASDITGWQVKVVEFFRHLGRTRHNFDPAIGLPVPPGDRTFQFAEGLVGRATHTPMGGYADLRNTYGAAKARSAFDEFFYSADVRRGKEQLGWYNIPHLGVFIWRLDSFPQSEPSDALLSTPVADGHHPGRYTFDPTGRFIPLFGETARPFGDTWVSPAEWQLPTPISTALWKTHHADVYADDSTNPTAYHAFGVYRSDGTLLTPAYNLIADSGLSIIPECGVFTVLTPEADDSTRLRTIYHYGFSDRIGAGFYDRRDLYPAESAPFIPIQSIQGGGDALAAALVPNGTLTVLDSLTYTAIATVGDGAVPIRTLTIEGENRTRPVIRLPAPDAGGHPAAWIFIGGASPTSDGIDAVLDLGGLLISGGDVILRGAFDQVTLRSCTCDPGTATSDGKSLATAVDDRVLRPCQLWIEGQVRQLTIERCIMGPIQVRSGGLVENLTVTDSIIQTLSITQPAPSTDSALWFDEGLATLDRCTILGPAHVHRLEASECIFDSPLTVEDTQDGCLRFSAWTIGSVIPRQYECVELLTAAPIFTARQYGRPGYAQVSLSADQSLIQPGPTAHDPTPKPTLLCGAQNGSEMGAFASLKNPIRVESLQIKYQEYMPVGLIPTLIYVT